LRIDVTLHGSPGTCALFLEPATLAPKFSTDVPAQRLRAACWADAASLEIRWRLALEPRNG